MKFSEILEHDAIKYAAIGGVVLIAGYYIIEQIKAAFNPTGSGGPGSVGNSVANGLTGTIAGTGTPGGALDNSYYMNAGLIGTLAATENTVSGGTLQAFGSWIGGKLADVFQPSFNGGSIPTSNASSEQSGAIQTSSNRPYQNGNNAAYADAVDSAPPDPAYQATPLTDSGSWDD